ncbi:MAG: hypothetical protein JWP25_7018 [Bradyrhizobium sp.]|jgi:hypothetical protein|nr:hypothetical protein [Bradyrhizobium sp.]
MGRPAGDHLFVAACDLFSLCSNSAMSDHPASWRMPSPKQMEKLASGRLQTSESNDPAPDSTLPPEYWEDVLQDPRAGGKPWLPIQQMRLSEIPRELLRVECARCSRCVEIQRLDAVKLYGPHAIWKDVGWRLLDDGCQVRTGRHEEDGCWPSWLR